MKRVRATVIAACVLASVAVGVPALAQDEDPKDIIATQLRKQGHACEKPASAVRDADASKPDEPVWILTCEGAKYRVRMVPDQAAVVEKLD
jgi:hypothetical protein